MTNTTPRKMNAAEVEALFASADKLNDEARRSPWDRELRRRADRVFDAANVELQRAGLRRDFVWDGSFCSVVVVADVAR